MLAATFQMNLLTVLTIVLKVSEGYFEVSVVDIKDGILLNQFFIEQKKSLYDE